MALSSNSKRAEVWKWEPGYYHPRLTDEQEAMLDATIKEVQQESTLSLDVQGGRSWVWRYMEGAQWRREPVRGKRVSSFFIDTLEWRQRENVDEVLDRAQDFAAEAASGKLFVRGQCLCGRSLIWVHLGRENNAVDPEENVRYLVYTLVSDILPFSVFFTIVVRPSNRYTCVFRSNLQLSQESNQPRRAEMENKRHRGKNTTEKTRSCHCEAQHQSLGPL